ncbi:MAG: cation diffusion facilitator family transporter [Methanomicrobiales archaeon]|nr:cation diffusion facilitator family transporter [Methanomicrobiales archaeon]
MNRGEEYYTKSLRIAIGVTLGILVLEVAGGFISGSLALLSDAGHMLVDGLSLGLSLGATIIAHRLPSKGQTFGFHRVEVLAALVNGVILFILSGVILYEAYLRILDPQPVDSGIMFVVAVIGLLANLGVAYGLTGSHDLNIRGAFLHVLGDALSSVAVVAGAIVITFTGVLLIDPFLSVIIVLVILVSTYRLVRESVAILLQYTPEDVDFDVMVKEMESVEGVDGVHNIHVWALCSHINVLDAHVYSCEQNVITLERMKQEIKKRLEKFNVRHSTLEFECEECKDCRLVREVEHRD